MTLCDPLPGCRCDDVPSCQYHHCSRYAFGIALVPASWKPPLTLMPKQFCLPCWKAYVKAWNTYMPGIDTPPNADEDWRPSLMDHLRHAEIAIAFAERQERERADRLTARNKPDLRWLAIVERLHIKEPPK